MTWYIGLDVGTNGGISKIDDSGKLVSFDKFPKNDKALATLLFDYLNSKNISEDTFYVGIEDVHSLFESSKKSNFSFGINKGKLIGMLEALSLFFNINLELVHAKVWQNKTWIDSDKVYKTSGKVRRTETKQTSLNAAKRIYPDQEFLATQRSSVPHDGCVDATLIAYYLYKTNKNDRE